MKVMRRARLYMASMAEGINPLNGEYAPPDDTISQERIQKCCAYVAGLLDKLIQNEGMIGNPVKKKFDANSLQLAKVNISAKPIGINEVAKRINAVVDKNMKGITGARIASWLADKGYLSIEKYSEQATKTRKVLNGRSHELGITMTTTVDIKTGKSCEKLLYSEKAQNFILSHLHEINDSDRK